MLKFNFRNHIIEFIIFFSFYKKRLVLFVSVFVCFFFMGEGITRNITARIRMIFVQYEETDWLESRNYFWWKILGRSTGGACEQKPSRCERKPKGETEQFSNYTKNKQHRLRLVPLAIAHICRELCTTSKPEIFLWFSTAPMI